MEKGGNNFPDEAFADLFAGTGRCSIAPRIVAVVMVLQRCCGMSDREAVDAFVFDARWKYAAGLLDFDPPGFVHTVLVDMRERLRRSTALYDAVATQDTVTLVRSALVDALALDGFAALASIDPDSEIIVATDVTAGNVGDAVPVPRKCRRQSAREGATGVREERTLRAGRVHAIHVP